MNTKIYFPEKGSLNNYQVEENSFWFQVRNLWISYFVTKWSTKGSFVDLGGGNGFVAKNLQRNKNLNILLIEPSLDGVNNAQSRGVNARQGTLSQNEDLKPVKNIGAFDVLEHIEDPKAFLHEIHHFLDEDGKLFITVPAYQFLWSAEDDYTGHQKRYSRKSLIEELHQTGFIIEKCSYFFSPLVPLIFLLRSLPYKYGRLKMANNSQDHAPTLSKKIVQLILKLEFKFFLIFKQIPFGASLIVVAKKHSPERRPSE